MAEPNLEHGAGEAVNTFPPFDPSTFASQLLWLVISFGLLYWILAKVVLPRLGDILEVRRDRILNDLDEAERMKGESEKAIASYKQTLAEARKKAHEIGLSIREKAQGEMSAEQAEIDAQLDEKTAKAEARISEIRNQALSEVMDISKEVAADMVNALIGIKPTKAALSKAAEAGAEKAQGLKSHV